MVKIYTKTGDRGMTGLSSGERVSKADQRIITYGEIDKLNSYLGLIVAMIQTLSKVKKENFATDLLLLEKTQSYLFEVGAILSCTPAKRPHLKLNTIPDFILESLEKRIDSMDEKLAELKNFILPGGSVLSGHVHVARCLCREAEIKIVQLHKMGGDEDVHPEFLQSLNRLSDYLFTLARFINLKLRKKEKIWVKQK